MLRVNNFDRHNTAIVVWYLCVFISLCTVLLFLFVEYTQILPTEQEEAERSANLCTYFQAVLHPKFKTHSSNLLDSRKICDEYVAGYHVRHSGAFHCGRNPGETPTETRGAANGNSSGQSKLRHVVVIFTHTMPTYLAVFHFVVNK